MALSLLAFAFLQVSHGQQCNFVQPTSTDMPYAEDVCRRIMDPGTDTTTFKKYVCVGSTGSWTIQEETHDSNDTCDDPDPAVTTISPYRHNCDAVGMCEYVAISQYEDDSNCNTDAIYTVDAVVTGVCIDIQSEIFAIGDGSGSMQFECQNGDITQHYCGAVRNPGCQCNFYWQWDELQLCRSLNQFEWHGNQQACLSRRYGPTQAPTMEPTLPTPKPTDAPSAPSSAPSTSAPSKAPTEMSTTLFDDSGCAQYGMIGVVFVFVMFVFC